MRSLPVLLGLVVLGCAGRNTASSPHTDPPELVSRSRPELRIPPGPLRQGVVLDVRMEVVIDSLGRPDLGTLRLTGIGASDNRDIILGWLESAKFRPGRQAGIPVAATYRDRWSAEARTRVIRSPRE